MSNRNRIILVVLVVLLAGIALKPLFFSDEFQPTQNPQEAFAKAVAEGRPVFLEFYAST